MALHCLKFESKFLLSLGGFFLKFNSFLLDLGDFQRYLLHLRLVGVLLVGDLRIDLLDLGCEPPGLYLLLNGLFLDDLDLLKVVHFLSIDVFADLILLLLEVQLNLGLVHPDLVHFLLDSPPSEGDRLLPLCIPVPFLIDLPLIGHYLFLSFGELSLTGEPLLLDGVEVVPQFLDLGSQFVDLLAVVQLLLDVLLLLLEELPLLVQFLHLDLVQFLHFKELLLVLLDLAIQQLLEVGLHFFNSFVLSFDLYLQ
jgi:hypothetical protein